MTPYNDIFRLHNEGLNNSQIESTLGTVTRKTIITTLKLAKEKNFDYSSGQLSDLEIHRILHPKKDRAERMPNVDEVMFDLGLPGNSIAKVWKEYKKSNPNGYSKSSFQNIVLDNRSRYPSREYDPAVELRYIKNAFTMVNGERMNCLFARVKYSDKIIVSPVRKNKTRPWIHGIINIIHQIGGIPEKFVFIGKLPKAVSAETTDCLSYYGIELEEASLKKDNRLMTFIHSTLKELGQIDPSQRNPFGVLEQRVFDYNSQPYYHNDSFTKNQAFEKQKLFLVQPPSQDYDLIEFIEVPVQMNRHVEVDGCYYSVPFEYRHEKLTVYLSDHYIDICYLNEIICTHKRLRDYSGQYSTYTEHLVEDDRIPFGEVSGKSLRTWAKKIGQNTEEVIDCLLRNRTFEIQGYKVCNSILHLSDTYGPKTLENACRAAIKERTITYSFVSKNCKCAEFKGVKTN